MYDLPVQYHEHSVQERRKIREQYVKNQNGLCFYCGTPLNEQPSNGVMVKPVMKDLFPPGFFDHPVHLQHCHKTGWTEGAVHAYCNAVMWQYDGR